MASGNTSVSKSPMKCMLGVFTGFSLFSIMLVASCIVGLKPATMIENLNGGCSNVGEIKSGK